MRKTKTYFTDDLVKKIELPPKPKQVQYFETFTRGGALVLSVSHGGTKSWGAVTYDDKHRAKSKLLGRFPALKTKDAREEARRHFENPEAGEEAEVETFRQVAEKWLHNHVSAAGLRSENEIRRNLTRYVYPPRKDEAGKPTKLPTDYPTWENAPFLTIRRKQVSELLDAICKYHGRGQADAVLATVRCVTNWAALRDETYQSPIIKGMKRALTMPRARILNDDEIRAVWAAASGTFGAFVKVLLLTAQRRQKTVEMRWTDVVDGVWTLPAEAREKGNAGEIVLPQLARDIIAAQPRLAENPFVFAGRGGAAFNAFSDRKDELDAKLPAEMPAWVLHDLRRTARSLLSRAGVLPHISERLMGHVIGGVEGVYDRHSYRDEKADAAKKLAALVDKILHPPTDNVVQLLTAKN